MTYNVFHRRVVRAARRAGILTGLVIGLCFFWLVPAFWREVAKAFREAA